MQAKPEPVRVPLLDDSPLGDGRVDAERFLRKIPAVTLVFWIMKILATTLGETAGDHLSKTLHLGYAASTLIFFGAFLVTRDVQLASRRYHPTIFWAVIVSTSTAGTTMSDYMDRTLGLGYALGSAILIGVLVTTLIAWRLTEKSISIDKVTSVRAELFYWTAILFSNTLGTALGDYLADEHVGPGLGFAGGALLIGAALALVVLATYFTKLSRVLLFWIAFVLTRPFGATMGDVLARSRSEGGLDFGTAGSSAVLGSGLVVLIVYEVILLRRRSLSLAGA